MMELSKILDKLAEKYPDDEDVMAAVELAGGEEEEGEFEDDMFADEEAPADEAAPADFDAMFAEDTEEDDEEDLELPPRK